MKKKVYKTQKVHITKGIKAAATDISQGGSYQEAQFTRKILALYDKQSSTQNINLFERGRERQLFSVIL